MFALRSPLDRGVMLADEAGMGNTVEADLVVVQCRVGYRRWIMLIAPATVRTITMGSE